MSEGCEATETSARHLGRLCLLNGGSGEGGGELLDCIRTEVCRAIEVRIRKREGKRKGQRKKNEKKIAKNRKEIEQ